MLKVEPCSTLLPVDTVLFVDKTLLLKPGCVILKNEETYCSTYVGLNVASFGNEALG